MGYFYRSREENKFIREHKFLNFVFLSKKLQQCFPTINTQIDSSSNNNNLIKYSKVHIWWPKGLRIIKK